ncbi:MAG: hypothetical protein J2P39_01320 [Candidatus Dormibacteraeota bacterium]|nr:hypothetical protein [Candidatus Dormibacteraeota bacterium]
MWVVRSVRIPLGLAALSVLVSLASLVAATALTLFSALFRSGCATAEGPPQAAYPFGHLSGLYEFGSAGLLVLLWLAALALALLTIRMVGPLLVRIFVGMVESAVLVTLGAIAIYALGLIRFLVGVCV